MKNRFRELDSAIEEAQEYGNPCVVVKKMNEKGSIYGLNVFVHDGNEYTYSKDVFKFNV